MRPRNLGLGLGLLLALGGCRSPQGTPSTPASAAGRAAEALLREAGDGSAVVLVLRPQQYGELRALLQPLLLGLLASKDVAERQAVDRVLAAPTLSGALDALLQQVAQQEQREPVRLTGLDESRPAVLGLFDVPRAELGDLALGILKGGRPGAGVPVLRHHLVLPFTDEAALRGSLRQVFALLRLREEAPGVFALGKHTGQLRVALGAATAVPGQRALRIAIFGDLDRHQAPPDAAREQEEALRPPLRGEVPDTPAWRHLIEQDGALSVHLRPWRLRALQQAQGARAVLAALSAADPEMQVLLGLVGWAEVATGALVIVDEGAEVDDVTLSLSGRGGALRLLKVSSLTALGRGLWADGVRKAPRVTPRPPQPPLLRLALGVNLPALLESVPAGPLGGMARRELVDRVRECGWACSAYVAMRTPLAGGQVAVREKPKLRDYLPTFADLTVLGLSGSVPQGALLLGFASPLGVEAQGLLGVMAKDGAGGKLWQSLLPLGERGQLLTLGRGVDPAVVYPERPLPREGATEVLALEVDSARLAASLPNHDLREGLSRFRAVQLQVALSGPALVGQLLLVPATAPPGAPVPLPSFADLRWRAPALDPATAGSPCLRRVIGGLSGALRSLAAAEPSQRRVLFESAAQQGAADWRCALGDPATRGSAERLRQAEQEMRRLLSAPAKAQYIAP